MKWEDKNTINFSWCTDDVKQQLKDRNKKEKLTLEQCREVLSRCLRKHDANFGMNWDIMDIHINDILEENK